MWIDEEKLIETWYQSSGILGSDKLNVYFSELARIIQLIPNRPVRVLEIGVQRAGNLAFLKSIFDSGSTIVGIDINRPAELPDGVLFYEGSANSPEMISAIAKLGQFDLIIEDSSHNQKLVRENIAAYGKLLKLGGFMMIEDTQYAFIPGWGKGLRGRKSVLRYSIDTLYRDLMFDETQSTEKFLINLNPYSITLQRVEKPSILRMDSQSGKVKTMTYPSKFEIVKKNLFLIWESKKPYIGYVFISFLRVFSSKLRNGLE